MRRNKGKPFTISRWMGATFIEWLLGVVLLLLLSLMLDAAGIEHVQCYLGIGMSAGVGLMQWLRLRKFMAVRTWWI